MHTFKQIFSVSFTILTCFEVSGMTCGNCVAKIKDQLDGKMGITRSQISLSQGTLTLHSEKALSEVEKKNVLEKLESLKYKGRSIPCTSFL